jgi:hypothetical protein
VESVESTAMVLCTCCSQLSAAPEGDGGGAGGIPKKLHEPGVERGGLQFLCII